MSAEYIMSEGNENIILCERGIRTYETYTRNTLDLSAVPVLHEITHLPVVFSPEPPAAIRGTAPEEANRRACAAGAWCVSHFGGRSGPTLQEQRCILHMNSNR